MRHNVLKKHSSKAERILYEVIKELGYPFKHRWIINGKEYDFVINKLVIELNGHEQSIDKNNELVELGYVPIHFTNEYIHNNRAQLKSILNKFIYD